MSSSSGSLLNNRKPFKLLAQFDAGELDQVREELQFLVATTKGKRYPKLLAYFEQWCKLDAAHQPVTRSQFTDGSSLPSSANAFDKLTSLFYNYLQEFLARREIRHDPVALQQLAFRAYRDRDFDWKEIHRRHGEAHRELDKLPQSSRLSHDRLLLDLDLALVASDRTIPSSERGYSELLAALEADYVIQKLRLLCAIANDRRMFAAPAPELSISSTLPPFRQTWPALARLYYGVYQLLTGEESQESMAALQKLLDEQDADSHAYPKGDMLDLYGYLLNAFSRKINQGDSQALQYLSNLYDQLVEKKLLENNGQIAAGHFKNMITVKLKAGDTEGARWVFDQVADKIGDDPDRNAVRYNHTLVLYAEGHLERAAQELEELCVQTHNLKLDLFYGLDMRGNLLKIYFDLLENPETKPLLWDETDEKMVRLLEAYKGYIERKKIPDHRRESYESYRKLIQALYFAAYRRDPQSKGEELQALEEEIRNSPEVVDAWFRKRLNKVPKN